MFGPIRRPPNGTCEAPDSVGLMHVGDASACMFVPPLIRRCWTTDCFTASENHKLPPHPSPPRGRILALIVAFVFFLFQLEDKSVQANISAPERLQSEHGPVNVQSLKKENV